MPDPDGFPFLIDCLGASLMVEPYIVIFQHKHGIIDQKTIGVFDRTSGGDDRVVPQFSVSKVAVLPQLFCGFIVIFVKSIGVPSSFSL